MLTRELSVRNASAAKALVPVTATKRRNLPTFPIGSGMPRCRTCGDVIEAYEPYTRLPWGDFCAACRPLDEVRACRQCGRRFVGLTASARICSLRCEYRRNAARRVRQRRQARQDRSCARCGSRFEASRGDAVYCSSSCRQAAYRKRVSTRDERPGDVRTAQHKEGLVPEGRTT